MKLVKKINGIVYTNSLIIANECCLPHDIIKNTVRILDSELIQKNNYLLIPYPTFKTLQYVLENEMESIDKAFKEYFEYERDEQSMNENDDFDKEAQKTIKEYQNGVISKEDYYTITDIIRMFAKENGIKQPEKFLKSNRTEIMNFLFDKHFITYNLMPNGKGYVLSKKYKDCGYAIEMNEHKTTIRYNKKGVKIIFNLLEEYINEEV